MARLTNAPLQEVIFEVRWRLQPDAQSGNTLDPDYELALGRLSSILESDFSYHRKITPSDFPDQMLFHRVVHQYWKSENEWPVLQLGPGIFTINCTDEKYDWESFFRPLIEKALDWLAKAYKRPMQFAFASLRYIDAIKIDTNDSVDWHKVVKTNFNIEYNNFFNTRGSTSRIQIDQSFNHDDGSEIQIQLVNGTKNNFPALILQTAVSKKHSFELRDLLTWTDYAHNITHDLFVELIKPDLYASFSRENKNSE